MNMHAFKFQHAFNWTCVKYLTDPDPIAYCQYRVKFCTVTVTVKHNSLKENNPKHGPRTMNLDKCLKKINFYEF